MQNFGRTGEKTTDPAMTPSEDVVRAIAQCAALSDRAILVGNRAGVVEWANDAWTRLTGFPIRETVHKPITHFLELAQFEIELVDFVAQHFREGRPCQVNFPFETFDERTIRVHLEVQPIRSASGEITEFVALANEATDQRPLVPDEVRLNEVRLEGASAASDRAEEASCVPIRRIESRPPARTPASPLPNIRRVSTSSIAGICAERFERRLGQRTHFDVELARNLPSIRTHRLLLEELVGLMLESAFLEIDESWGFVTLLTGRLPAGRQFVSAVHGMTAILPPTLRAEGEDDMDFQFIEVHDTGTTLSEATLEAIRLGVRLLDPRAQMLATAAALAPTLGGSLHVDSTPGCGTQALLILPRHA